MIDTLPCRFGCGAEFGSWYPRLLHENKCVMSPTPDWSGVNFSYRALQKTKVSNVRKVRKVPPRDKEKKRVYDHEYYIRVTRGRKGYRTRRQMHDLFWDDYIKGDLSGESFPD